MISSVSTTSKIPNFCIRSSQE